MKLCNRYNYNHYLCELIYSQKHNITIMKQVYSGGFNQTAMKYGTYLGITWAAMYIMLFNGVTSPMLLLMAMVLFFASPFIAGRFAIRYRKDELGNSMDFSQAFKFLFIMYICATLLSAATNYIYLNYIDNGTFLAQIDRIMSEAAKLQANDAAALEQLNATREMFSRFSTSSITWEFLNNNIFSSIFLPPIIAFFVKKNNQ